MLFMHGLRTRVLIRQTCHLRRAVYARAVSTTTKNTTISDSDSHSDASGSGDSGGQPYDVIICGGGMVGTAMACALGYSDMFKGKQILLLEGAPKKDIKLIPGVYANRTCSLNAGAIDLLTSFGAWNNIVNMRCQEVKRMQIWDSTSDSIITFNQRDMTENLAYVAENDVILKGITEQLEKLSDRIDVKYDSHVDSYQLSPSVAGTSKHAEASRFAQLTLKSGETLQAKLLIGADGFQSLLRKTAGFRTLQDDYKQTALVASLKLAEPINNNTAWQRFLQTGPIAMLPLSDQYCNLIWSTSPEDAANLMALPAENFVDAVNSAFWSEDAKNYIATSASRAFDSVLTTLGCEGSSSQQLPPSVISAESRATFPLSVCHSSQYVTSRAALIGDAAHRVHPLAGQGVNLGFGDVACLRDNLTKALHDGRDIGSLGHLLQYETRRQRTVVVSMATVDGLNRLYRSSWLPLVIARTLGLQATNAIRPIKEKMIQFAAG